MGSFGSGLPLQLLRLIIAVDYQVISLLIADNRDIVFFRKVRQYLTLPEVLCKWALPFFDQLF